MEGIAGSRTEALETWGAWLHDSDVRESRLFTNTLDPRGTKRLFLLGSYDPEGVRGLSLPVARDRAAELTALYRTGTLDLHGHFERQRADQERARKSRRSSGRRKRHSAPPWGICSMPTSHTWNS
jgi:hypothetical protein